jgi:hypothetical protein
MASPSATSPSATSSSATPTPTTPTRESKVRTAFEIVGILAAIAAAIIGFLTLLTTINQAAVSTAKITDPAALADPNNCTYQTTVKGFRMSGETKLLHGDALWVLLSPDGSPSFYITSDRAVTKASGPWSINLTDVGDPTDKPGEGYYTFLVVSADPSGSSEILKAYQAGNGELDHLPNGVNVMTTGCAKRK